ncbi:MAG TPA: SCP2 sterol-binding domain-containing protein [Ktedonobacteraceae bacterium]|nr:SCP2 sterol-binding domain-containing protein [Ktedonobacteraceae bacterium]
MTISELFESMPERFNTTAAEGVTKTIQWNITGDEPGIWAFQITNGVGQLIPGGVEKADTTFTISGKNWIAIAEGKTDPMKAFMTGRLKVAGDMMLAMKVPQFFPVES